MTDTMHVRGEGGAIWEMDLPLRPDHAARLADGRLVRVNPDGSTYAEVAAPVSVPAPDGDDDADDDADEVQPPELAAFLATPPPPVKPAKAARSGR